MMALYLNNLLLVFIAVEIGLIYVKMGQTEKK